METFSNGEQRYCPTPLVIRLIITDRVKGRTKMSETTMDFESYKDSGVKFKETGNLRDALIMYEKALQCAQTKEHKIEIWNLIIHIHTDRMIASCQELAEIHDCDVSDLDWEWGPKKIPSNYNRPTTEELLK